MLKRLTLSSGVIVVTGSFTAVLLLVSADTQVDQRKEALLASNCTRHIDVPPVALFLNWSATILLLLAGVATVVFLVSALRFGSPAFRALAVVVAAPAFILTVGYALLVGAALVDPDTEEPISPRYHPCSVRT